MVAREQDGLVSGGLSCARVAGKHGLPGTMELACMRIHN